MGLFLWSEVFDWVLTSLFSSVMVTNDTNSMFLIIDKPPAIGKNTSPCCPSKELAITSLP